MAFTHKEKHDTDMTRGSIARLLLAFAIPLMLGNLFQQLYNTVDSLIVGNFVGKQALAAVGCTGMSTGPHLHFEVRQDGEAQNPVAYFDSAIRDSLKAE